MCFLPLSDVQMVPKKIGEIVDEPVDTASNKYTDTGAVTANSTSTTMIAEVR